jgi:HprK-related kinase A
MFEWGLNWCVATRSNRFLLVHSAVVEKGGHAVLLPAPPGSGKSTLCAALVCRGWRLLSDELAMLQMDGRLVPVPRPVSLKNASIDVIRKFDPGVVIGGTAYETHKGTVAYMRPPADSVDRQSEPALPRWVVFPKFEAGAKLRFESYSKARTLVYLAHNSFNYHIHGARGFELLGNVLDHCDCYNLSYGSLEDALACIEGLAETADQPPSNAA